MTLLAVGTGQRGQDLVVMTWAAFDGSAVEVVQQKTGRKSGCRCMPEPALPSPTRHAARSRS